MIETSSSTWWPVDLREVIATGATDPPPILLSRTDDAKLLYAGRIHSFHGEPESLKSWAARVAEAETVRAGGHVLVIDFEDSAASLVARLLALDVHPDLIIERVHYVRPGERLDDDGRVAIDHVLDHHAPLLVTIDGVNEALGLFGLDLASNMDYSRWLAALPRPLAATGAAVVLIDHVAKNKDNRGRGAIGAQHKLAGIDVAFAFDVSVPFGRGRNGIARIFVDKDRPGHVRAVAGKGRHAGDLHLESDPETGNVRAHIEPPVSSEGPFRPTMLMQRVADYLATHPDVSGRHITDNVAGKGEYVRVALDALVVDGYVERHDGPRNATLHRLIRPFTETK